MSKIIGIDLGTTNSLAAYWENGECHLIPNALGEYLTPSVVSFDKDGTVYVGKVAKERLISCPERTVSVFKRSMGTERTWLINGKSYRPEELSAIVLKKLKEDAENFLGEPVEEAIISVPAYFGDLARKATRNAGQLAGLKVERIINEPSAAALACQNMNKMEDAKILVYDFGGGTLDVSLVECFDNVIEIIAVNGNNHLGGSDFDRVIAEYFCKMNQMQFSLLSPQMQGTVLSSAEKVKRSLTLAEEAIMTVNCEEFQGSLSLSRKDLIRISSKIFQKMAEPVKQVLLDSKTQKSQLSQVVLVGGSCKMPVVQQYLRYLMKDIDVATTDPDHMIALGVGTYAGIKERDRDISDMILTDICPFSLGVNVLNHADASKSYMSILIPRNSALPISREAIYTTSSDNQRHLVVGVYQGEDMYVDNNLFLGKISVSVPPAPKGVQKIAVRFTYDINGLLVVDITVLETGKKHQMVFVNGITTEVDEEMKHKLEAMNKLKTSPREDEKIKLLLSRAERIYTQLNGDAKVLLEVKLKNFNLLLVKEDKYQIQKEAAKFAQFIESLEKDYLSQDAAAEDDFDDFIKWFDEEENKQDEEDDIFSDWTGSHYLS